MKKLILTPALLIVLLLLSGADINQKRTDSEPKPQRCYGYTIIEFGKGINCNGDTIRLVKVDGGGQRVAQDPRNQFGPTLAGR